MTTTPGRCAMPLETTEWETVKEWALVYLFKTLDPHTALERAGFATAFVTRLKLTARPADNAAELVGESLRSIPGQVALLEALLRTGLADHEDAHMAGDFLARLREDARTHGSEDPFGRYLLKNGTEAFLDRENLRTELRTFLTNPHTAVLVVDGEPDSGRSYTYTFIRHIGQHRGFRPVRVILDPASTAGRVLAQLAAFVEADTALSPAPPGATGLDDLLPTRYSAVLRVVREATDPEAPVWFVLDECDRLDPGSDVWELIGQLARAVSEYEPRPGEQPPRLVLLGYSEAARPLPHDLRNSIQRDRARVAGPAELRTLLAHCFREVPPPVRFRELAPQEREAALTELAEVALAEVLHAVGEPGDRAGPACGGARERDSYMRRLCSAVEGAVRVYRAL
ncbi:hypothetical protein I3F58_04975 [Streptomyces sp. MUM 203J]|uniref:hypothetical protein n=1 Tax=Streptomyces sp. MUM 203J TaxID=2791990 RepID=UPI001F03F18C|nr:hypothetical protein [Streptomyces sp. MUM 203J]MCH0538919.1 hypothetical protein [Streptomyces sp. MUM 203J]